jgi:ATP-dependent Clp protease ATP-binding subunit ClpA
MRYIYLYLRKPKRRSLKMNTAKLTQKAQEALQAAQAISVRLGHQELDGEHLLLALLDQESGLVARLVERIGANVATLRARLQARSASGDKRWHIRSRQNFRHATDESIACESRR